LATVGGSEKESLLHSRTGRPVSLGCSAQCLCPRWNFTPTVARLCRQEELGCQKEHQDELGGKKGSGSARAALPRHMAYALELVLLFQQSLTALPAVRTHLLATPGLLPTALTSLWGGLTAHWRLCSGRPYTAQQSPIGCQLARAQYFDEPTAPKRLRLRLGCLGEVDQLRQ